MDDDTKAGVQTEENPDGDAGKRPTPNNVANLNRRDSRKQQAQLRNETADKAGTPAKKVAKKVAAKATGAKEPAKKTAAKKVTKTADPNRIKWTTKGEKDAKGEAEADGEAAGDRHYEIRKQDDGLWRCTVKVGNGGASTVIAENLKTGKVAWQKCVDHAKGKKEAAA
jgi:hypothetical protein